MWHKDAYEEFIVCVWVFECISSSFTQIKTTWRRFSWTRQHSINIQSLSSEITWWDYYNLSNQSATRVQPKLCLVSSPGTIRAPLFNPSASPCTMTLSLNVQVDAKWKARDFVPRPYWWLTDGGKVVKLVWTSWSRRVEVSGISFNNPWKRLGSCGLMSHDGSQRWCKTETVEMCWFIPALIWLVLPSAGRRECVTS